MVAEPAPKPQLRKLSCLCSVDQMLVFIAGHAHLVVQDGVGHIDRSPPMAPGSPTQISIFKVDKEPGIKPAQRLKAVSADQEASGASPGDLIQTLGGCRVFHGKRWDHGICEDSGNEASSPVNHPSSFPIELSWVHCKKGRILVEDVYELPDTIWGKAHVIIDEKEIIALSLLCRQIIGLRKSQVSAQWYPANGVGVCNLGTVVEASVIHHKDLEGVKILVEERTKTVRQ